MAPKFGTSGLRGLAVELTDDLCARYAAAFCGLHVNDGRLFVGQDKRDSSPRIAAAVARGAASAGLSVVDCGILPTPAMAGAALEAGTISIMVTGSHIPADRNGLKFYTSTGEFTKADEAPLADAVGTIQLATDASPIIERTSRPAGAYVSRYIKGLGKGALAGKKVGIWLHSSAASDVLPEVLSGMGAEVVPLGASPTFVPVDTEAVDAETRAMLSDWVQKHRLDAIVSTDGDADRPLLIDDRGAVVPGDILGPITAGWLGAETVVTTVSANSMVELSGAFETVKRTKIGSPFVIAEMERAMIQDGSKVAGYEPNGGFLLGWHVAGRHDLPTLMTRDAFLPLLSLLAASAEAGSPISTLVDAMPARRTATDRLQDVPREASLAIVAAILGGDMSVLPDGLGPCVDVDETDGVRLTFEGGTIVHIRPSGNAPELRCYVEADSTEAAGAVLAEALEKLRQSVS